MIVAVGHQSRLGRFRVRDKRIEPRVAARPGSARGAEPADQPPSPPSDETTPTNPAPPAELYARPLRRSTSQPADEDLPPPPPAMLKPPPSPRVPRPAAEDPALPPPPPPPPPPCGGSNLQALLAEKVAERRRRLSLGDVRGAPAGEAAPPSPARDTLAAGDRVEQVTRIQVGKKQLPSGIPSPTKTIPQGMTKSHTIGSLSDGAHMIGIGNTEANDNR